MTTFTRTLVVAGLTGFVAVAGATGVLANTRDRDIAWKEYIQKAPAAETFPMLQTGRAATMVAPPVRHERLVYRHYRRGVPERILRY